MTDIINEEEAIDFLSGLYKKIKDYTQPCKEKYRSYLDKFHEKETQFRSEGYAECYENILGQYNSLLELTFPHKMDDSLDSLTKSAGDYANALSEGEITLREEGEELIIEFPRVNRQDFMPPAVIMHLRALTYAKENNYNVSVYTSIRSNNNTENLSLKKMGPIHANFNLFGSQDPNLLQSFISKIVFSKREPKKKWTPDYSKSSIEKYFVEHEGGVQNTFGQLDQCLGSYLSFLD